MITVLLHLLRLLPFLFGGHRQLVLENVALRHQLAIYKRTVTRPRLRRTDRFLWIALVRMWSGWRRSLLIVTPDTVLRCPVGRTEIVVPPPPRHRTAWVGAEVLQAP